MEHTNAELIRELELRTQEYSVFITDSRRTSCGSGILYYSGNASSFYIFTCAHVVDELMEPIEVHLFIPRNRGNEDYQTYQICARHEQIRYSPIDEVSVEFGVKKHSVDVAVICLEKTEELPLQATHYMIAEAQKSDSVFAQGFPGGAGPDDELLEILDTAHGTVLHSLPNRQTFLFRVEDNYLDSGNRIHELEGFSGAPVWNGEEKVLSLLGLFAFGSGQTVYRSKVSAVKMDAVRSIMKNHFNVHLETRIVGIPEREVAQGGLEYHEAAQPSLRNGIYDEWLAGQLETVWAYIDDIKFQKAIDAANAALQDERFQHCSDDMAKRHLQCLLYCYESCLLEDDFSRMEAVMNERGLLDGHEPLRWMTFNFELKKYQETAEYAEMLLASGTENDDILIMARVFHTICGAYTKKAPVEAVLLPFMDEQETLTMTGIASDTETFLYQLFGFVYGECYGQYTKAIRCFNRSYRIGCDNAVLESLACAYYFLALQGAVRSDDTVDTEHVNQAALYKARECFLILLDKTDELYLSAMMKREGIVLFNTFYFLQDTYRILTIYPLLRKYLPLEDDREKHDLELKYAMTLCQGGEVDLSLFDTLTAEERTVVGMLGAMNGIMTALEFKEPASLRIPRLEHTMQRLICTVEDNLRNIDEREKLSVTAALVNLYGWGRRIFHWDIADKMKGHVNFIKSTDNANAAAAFENFLFENSHTAKEAEAKYIQSWRENPSFELWQEILQFYKRNWMLDKADHMFCSLFENHTEYIRDNPEYAYRAYIHYIIHYKRDLKAALRFFIEHKNEMMDRNVRDFWEHELMCCTNSFNDPECFDAERLSFVRQGLLSPDEYHRMALIAYMCNLNSKMAWEHFDTGNPYLGFFPPFCGPYLTPESAQFLIWQRRYPPHMEPTWNGMVESRIPSVQGSYKTESFHASVEEIKNRTSFEINRTIAIDAWSLYLLAAENHIDSLKKFDVVYVTHSSIGRMLEDMCHYKNSYLEHAIAYLEAAGNVQLQAPDFEHQLSVREKAEYYEPCSTIAMALEAGCPAVIGEPALSNDIISDFKDVIVRPCDFHELLDKTLS